ncbi:MAG TPA: hypothetical protein VJ576_22055 [Rhodocyclaceae bacterium]|nr:hypothetical protein [Rhodocyclaceae bacterium]
MHPIHDVDVLLLLATALAAKRRPAEPAEIMAAVDLIQGNIPSEDKLSEAFSRLGKSGLLDETAGCVALTAAAENIVQALPRKAELGERLLDLRGLLAAHAVAAEGAAVLIAPEQLRAAILAHRAANQGAGKNLLVPKPKPEASQQRPGQRQRKPAPAQRRKR